VHPAAGVRHRWRPARAPASRPGTASRAAVHGQSALHGVDPPISRDPHPPADNAHHRLPAGKDVDVFHRDLLLTLTAVAVERFERRGEASG
jgi:hypothetical protein